MSTWKTTCHLNTYSPFCICWMFFFDSTGQRNQHWVSKALLVSKCQIENRSDPRAPKTGISRSWQCLAFGFPSKNSFPRPILGCLMQMYTCPNIRLSNSMSKKVFEDKQQQQRTQMILTLQTETWSMMRLGKASKCLMPEGNNLYVNTKNLRSLSPKEHKMSGLGLGKHLL